MTFHTAEFQQEFEAAMSAPDFDTAMTDAARDADWYDWTEIPAEYQGMTPSEQAEAVREDVSEAMREEIARRALGYR